MTKVDACHFEPFGHAQDKLREKSFSISFEGGGANDRS
jgi:hypothetical protein